MISILTPTRERPENVRRLIASVVSTAKEPLNVELLFYVDHDDQTFPEDVLSDNVRLIRGPRMWLSLLQNVLYASSRGEIVMYAGDDLVFETFGWDTRVVQRTNWFWSIRTIVPRTVKAWQFMVFFIETGSTR
jgi:glycosyltransferase involved in cell wall biosynthesis